jgi:hypothetical protein
MKVQASSINTVTSYGLDNQETVVQFLTETSYLSFLWSAQTSSWTHPASYSMHTVSGTLYQELTQKLTIHLLLTPRLRMRGAECPFPHAITFTFTPQAASYLKPYISSPSEFSSSLSSAATYCTSKQMSPSCDCKISTASW